MIFLFIANDVPHKNILFSLKTLTNIEECGKISCESTRLSTSQIKPLRKWGANINLFGQYIATYCRQRFILS